MVWPRSCDCAGMKNLTWITLLAVLLWPAAVQAAVQKPEENVNSRYEVESVQISGVSESKVSKSLRDDMQKLVGEKYNQEAANEIARKLRKELRDYSVDVKVKRGE